MSARCRSREWGDEVVRWLSVGHRVGVLGQKVPWWAQPADSGVSAKRLKADEQASRQLALSLGAIKGSRVQFATMRYWGMPEEAWEKNPAERIQLSNNKWAQPNTAYRRRDILNLRLAELSVSMRPWSGILIPRHLIMSILLRHRGVVMLRSSRRLDGWWQVALG